MISPTKRFLALGRLNSKQRGELPLPPLRTIKEMAAEFGVPHRGLIMAVIKNNPTLIRMRTTCAKSKTTNSWVEPNDTRKWWAEYKLKRELK